MKRLAIATVAAALFLLAGVAFAAPVSSLYRSIVPEADNTYYVGSTTPSNLRYNGVFNNITVTGTCTGCGGGGGAGNVSTSSAEAATRIAVWNSTGATPALISGGFSNLTFDGTQLYTTKIGVATTTPYGQLTVSGNGTTDAFAISTSSDAVTAFRISRNGNVHVMGAGIDIGNNVSPPGNGLIVAGKSGFGTTTPTHAVHVAGPGNTSTQVGIEDTSAAANSRITSLQTLNAGLNVNSETDAGATTTLARFSSACGAVACVLVGTSTQLSATSIGTFTAGSNSTTTVSVGEIGSATSKSSFNMQADDGTTWCVYVHTGGTLTTSSGSCK